MIIRVALLGGDELVRRGLESMLKTLGGFELGTVKDRARLPIDIALVETFGTSLQDTTLARAVADAGVGQGALQKLAVMEDVADAAFQCGDRGFSPVH